MKQKQVNLGKKPDLVYAAFQSIPKDYQQFVGESKDLDSHQQLGVNLILTQFLVRKGKGFLLADGTGVGKTRQILKVAQMYKQITGKRVLIITENKTILAGSFASDSVAMGIPLSQFETGTYTDVRLGKKGKRKFGLVIFDEAHNLKNAGSAQTQSANGIDAEHRLFCTATPLDTIGGAAYFVSEVSDMSESEILKFLGFTLSIQKKGAKVAKSIVLDKNTTFEFAQRSIIKLRDKLIASGAMLRREYPFWGKVDVIRIKPKNTYNEEYDLIKKYWRRRGNGRGVAAKEFMELTFWNEYNKTDLLFEHIEKDRKIEPNAKVIIISDLVNDWKCEGLGKDIITSGSKIERKPASFPSLIKKIQSKFRVPISKVYGENDKAAEVAAFQSGKTNILIATPRSGGTGINLDDTKGNAPRKMYIATPNFSGNLLQQVMGRISRRNTKTPSWLGLFYFDSPVDWHRERIVERKLASLRAIQRGVLMEEDIYDLDGDFKTKDKDAKFIALLELSNNDNDLIVDFELANGGIFYFTIRGILPANAYKIFAEKYKGIQNDQHLANRMFEVNISDFEWIQRLSMAVSEKGLLVKTKTQKGEGVVTEQQPVKTKKLSPDLFGFFPPETTNTAAKTKATATKAKTPKNTKTTTPKSGSWYLFS